jgi:predicted RNA-binding Zn-ribbon protein involved in translation (DUF1610 family)
MFLEDDIAATRFIGRHYCPDCGPRQLLARNNSTTPRGNTIRCPKCGREDGFVREQTLTERWKQNPDSVPVTIASKLETKYGAKPMTTTELVKADPTALVKRMEGARWLADLAPQDKRVLADLAIAYGLDPLMGEMTMYEKRPYISVNGMIRVAHEHPLFEGLEDRPMSQEEKQAYGITQKIGWIAKVYRRGWRAPSVGTGAADPDRPFRNNPVERERPQWMARSRAIRQALRLAFPAAVPFKARFMEERGEYIDAETGEIHGGEVDEVDKPYESGRTEAEIIAEIENYTPPTEAEVDAADVVDESDRPEPTQQEAPPKRFDAAESQRVDLLAAIKDLAKQVWSIGTEKALLTYWSMHFKECGPSPEQGTVKDLTELHDGLAKMAAATSKNGKR